MIRSMTGYGQSTRALEEGVLRVEIRTVNHRFFNASIRTPQGFERFEHELPGWLRPHILRGHVHVAVSLEGALAGREGLLPELDLERARHWLGLLRRLRGELDLPGEPDLAQLARFGDVFRVPDAGGRPHASVAPEVLRELVEEAARSVVVVREAEGRRLREDMEERLRVLGEEADRVAGLGPGRLVRERERLRAAVRELTDQESVDEDRLAREVAYLAERWDLNEELVRFRSHMKLFLEALAAPAGDGVGKRLSFIVQEMHREVNTIGAKANDAGIARSAVAMKEEVERLREQVENVE